MSVHKSLNSYTCLTGNNSLNPLLHYYFHALQTFNFQHTNKQWIHPKRVLRRGIPKVLWNYFPYNKNFEWRICEYSKTYSREHFLGSKICSVYKYQGG